MKTFVSCSLVYFLLAGAAHADCQTNLSFLNDTKRDTVCNLEAQTGFRVREKGIKSKHIYFINWDEKIKKNVKTRTGIAYNGDGKAFSSAKAAQKSITTIAGQQRCSVKDWQFNAKGGSTFMLSCKMGN